MALVNIEIDDVRDRADDFRSEGGEMQELISRCDSLLDELMSVWEGSASQAFENQWNDLKPSLEDAVELLESIGEQLDGVADTMEETDEALAASMGV